MVPVWRRPCAIRRRPESSDPLPNSVVCQSGAGQAIGKKLAQLIEVASESRRQHEEQGADKRFEKVLLRRRPALLDLRDDATVRVDGLR